MSDAEIVAQVCGESTHSDDNTEDEADSVPTISHAKVHEALGITLEWLEAQATDPAHLLLVKGWMATAARKRTNSLTQTNISSFFKPPIYYTYIITLLLLQYSYYCIVSYFHFSFSLVYCAYLTNAFLLFICLINPRHACAEEVTVVVPRVCVCVCVCVRSFLPACACTCRSKNIGTNGFTATQEKVYNRFFLC